ncbi:MAG: Replication protein P [Bacteriophage sp.]|nr:MAG: Replication protein P [Bacteriophage sp.]
MDGGDEMTEEQVGKLLMTIQAYYPNYNPPDKKITLNAWYIMLAEYSEELVLQALRACIATNTSGFAPDVGQIMSKIQTISQPQELDGMAAWGLVSKALRNGTYGAVEEFNKLPPLVRQAVGIPDNLKNWATSDYQTIETVIQSNFLRTYETAVKRANEINRMPDNIKSLIKKTNANSCKAQIEQKFQRDINTLPTKVNALIGQNTNVEEYIEAPQDIQERINAMR